MIKDVIIHDNEEEVFQIQAAENVLTQDVAIFGSKHYKQGTKLV